MSVADLLTNDQFFELKLMPAMNRLKGHKPKLKMVDAWVGNGGETALTIPEWLLYGHAREFKAGPIGFDPTNLRASCADQADQMAQFLQTCATGKLHINCWQYLIGPITQLEFRAGKRPSYGSLLHKTDQVDPLTATEKITKGVDEGIALDNDLKRVATQRSFDAKFREKLYIENNRKHLLEDKNEKPS